MGELALLVVIGSTIWLGVDASGRDFSQSGVSRSTAGWVLGSLVLWLVFFPLYLAQRRRAPVKGQRAPMLSGDHGSAPVATWAPPAASVAPPLWARQAAGAAAAEFKACPDCAELIRSAARKCRYCGWTADD